MNILKSVENISIDYFTYESGSKLKQNYFNNYENTRKYLKWLFNILNYKEYEDIYQLKRIDLKKKYGNSLLKKYKSITNILKKYIPEYTFYGFKFKPVHNDFYKEQENIRECLDYIYNDLKYNELNDFYNISQKDINNYSFGSRLITLHNGIYNLIKYAYPEKEWYPWLFRKTYYYFTDKQGKLQYENIKHYMDWLCNRLGYFELEKLYDIQKHHFEKNYGGGLLSHKFNNCILDIIVYAYPEINWLPWKFKQIQRFYWSKDNELQKDNIIHYIKWLEKEFNIKKLEDWYNYDCNTFRNNYGSSLLALFKGSISSLLKYVYDEYSWDLSKFNTCPNNYWSSIENQRNYILNEIGDNFDNIYNIEIPAGLMRYYENFQELFNILFPEKVLNIEKMRRGRGRKGQIIIEKILNDIINQFENILEICYRCEFNIINIFNDKYPFRIDYQVIIKDINTNLKNILFIEIDGIQHFENVSNWLSYEKQQNRDIYKMKYIIDNIKDSKIIRIYQPDILNNNYYCNIKNIIIDNLRYTNCNPEYYCLSNQDKYNNHKEIYNNMSLDIFEYNDLY